MSAVNSVLWCVDCQSPRTVRNIIVVFGQLVCRRCLGVFLT